MDETSPGQPFRLKLMSALLRGEAALSAIAVLVDEGPPQKKRVIFKASQDVMLNHKIRVLKSDVLTRCDRHRAREKRYSLRFLEGT